MGISSSCFSPSWGVLHKWLPLQRLPPWYAPSSGNFTNFTIRPFVAGHLITCHERTCTRSGFAILFDRMFVLSLGHWIFCAARPSAVRIVVSSIIALSESLSTTFHSTIIFLILCSRSNNRPRISKCRIAFCTPMMDT